MGKRTVRFIVALVFSAAIMLGCFGDVIPNMTIVVQAANSLKNGKEVSGNMSEDSSEIKYELTISKVSLVDLECTSKKDRLYFGLFDSASQMIGEESSEYYAMTHVAQVLVPGTYTVRVQRQDTSPKTSIGFRIVPRIVALKGNEKTPDSSTDPVVLKMKKRVYGSIAFNDETDVYKFTVKQKGNVSIHLTCQMYAISKDMSRSSESRFDYSIKDNNLSVIESGSVRGMVDSPSTSIVTREYEAGDYYIFITRASKSYTGEYAVMCIQNAFSTTGLKMTGSNNVVVGKTIQYKVNAIPSSSKDSASSWKTSNTSVLRININSATSGAKSCSFNALECGEAVITATLDSNKLVTVKKKIKVVPASPKVTSLKNSGAGEAKLIWKKTKTADGYQIQYNYNNSGFTANVKSAKVKDQNNKTLKSLKKNKTYYVRIRSYKVASDGKTYYSDWSKVQKVKITK